MRHEPCPKTLTNLSIAFTGTKQSSVAYSVAVAVSVVSPFGDEPPFLRRTKLGKEYFPGCFSLALACVDSREPLRLSGLQQHPMAAWRMKARSVRMAAIHMKTNILMPMSALMLSSSWAVSATLAATLMTVAMMAATVMIKPEMAAMRVTGMVNQRVRMTSGELIMRTKLMTVPAVKKAYMI